MAILGILLNPFHLLPSTRHLGPKAEREKDLSGATKIKSRSMGAMNVCQREKEAHDNSKHFICCPAIAGHPKFARFSTYSNPRESLSGHFMLITNYASCFLGSNANKFVIIKIDLLCLAIHS